MFDNYQDIINKPHHTSKTRKRMSLTNRAAQFAPFAALTGYENSISEAARLTDKIINIDEQAKEMLNFKLNFLKNETHNHPFITVTYFVPDSKKDGGAYQKFNGYIRRFDEFSNSLIMQDKTIIKIEMIYDITCNIFNEISNII